MKCLTSFSQKVGECSTIHHSSLAELAGRYPRIVSPWIKRAWLEPMCWFTMILQTPTREEYMTNTSLAGKVALVTGGNRNIGRETALALAARGANVVITFKEQADSAAQTVRDLEALGVKATAIQVDLTGTAQHDQLTAGLESALSNWGQPKLDILVNNAGTLRLGMFDNITEDDLDAVYQTNYKSIFFLTQRLVPLMSDGGRIVNLGSGTARIAFGPLVSYGPFKAALQSLTLYLAAFLGPRSITVNAVAPGGLDDDFNATLFDHVFPPAREFIKSNTAVGRIGMPPDIGGVIAFLCSDEASFISGAVIPVDGGYHL
jgi:NAD(P)-dependent dehydrogenase (short-subunit alcohol dehydrogenase family)